MNDIIFTPVCHDSSTKEEIDILKRDLEIIFQKLQDRIEKLEEASK